MHFTAKSSRSNLSPSCRGRPWLKGKALVAANFNNGEPVRRSHLTQHAMHVVLHGLFGEVQPAGHFLIGEPLLDQAHQFLLAPAEAKRGLEMQAGNGGLMTRYPLK